MPRRAADPPSEDDAIEMLKDAQNMQKELAAVRVLSNYANSLRQCQRTISCS